MPQGTISISATAYSGNYDEGSHNAVSNIVVSPSDATKIYSLNNGSYSSTIPTVSAQGTYRVKIKATKPGYVDNEIQKTVTISAMSVATAKSLVKRDGLRAHLGEEVDYNPSAGGTWRIFYYDNENDGNGNGYFGKLNTLYLKSDLGNRTTNLNVFCDSAPSDNGFMMRKMNPKWAKSSYSVIDTKTERCAANLCDSDKWEDYKVEGVADYAIAAPGIEMYIKAYNVYKDNNPNSTTLTTKIENQLGYSIEGNSNIESGPNYLFWSQYGHLEWIASPCSESEVGVFAATKSSGLRWCGYSNGYQIRPIVSISL